MAAPEATTLKISKSVDIKPAEIGPDRTFTYTLSFSCSALVGPCANIQIVDVLPPEVAFVELLGQPGFYNAATRTVTFRPGSTAGQTAEARIAVKFPAGTAPGTVATNRATMTADGAAEPVQSNPVAVTALAASSWDLIKGPATSGTVAQLDTPYTYRVRFIVNAGSTQALNDVEFVDALPAGVQFVSATQGGSYDAGANTVRWAVGSITPSQTKNVVISRDVTVIFPSSVFTANQTVTNEVDCNGQPQGGSFGLLDRATFSTKLRASGPVAGIKKRATRGTLGPGQVDSYTIELSNSNASAITGPVAEDQLPPQLAVVSDGQPNLTGSQLTPTAVRARPIGGAYTAVTVQNLGGGSWGAVLPADTDAFQVEYGTVPAGASTTLVLRAGVPASGIGRDGQPIANGTSIKNCAKVSAANVLPRTSCVQQIITSVLVNFAKSRTSASVVAATGDFNARLVTWRLDVDVDQLSAGGLTSPSISDCLPPGLDLVVPANPADPRNFTSAGLPPSTVTRTPGGCGSGQVLVTWAFASTITPGQQGSITLNTIVAEGTPPGTVTNTATLASAELSVPLERQDSVGIASDVILVGFKEVKGDLDSGFVTYPTIGRASPGGSATYRLTIKNQSDIPVTSLTILDTLPTPGDRGVVTDTDRGSEWEPIYAAGETGPDVALFEASASHNPCRPEFGVVTGCDDPGWFPLPASNPSVVGALRASFGDFVLQPGQSLVFTWNVDVPADAPVDAVAWNSFGYEAQRVDNGQQLLPAEPNKVGLQVVSGPGPTTTRPPSGCSGSGCLPATGSNPRPPILLGGVLLAIGLLLAAVARLGRGHRRGVL